jgi:hypothetical protein
MSVEPAIAALAGLGLLGEQLTARQWLGLGAIIATSVGTTLTASQACSPTPQGADPIVGDFPSDVARDVEPHIASGASVPPTDALT